ncbi:MFS family permease [Microbacterium sp. W4I4]|uniref:MFS transporter n=1 Tax=Microbacterium sp. W4I4 TaxID=3042295 RepID=UPI002783F209|nr:MFS transporter [Microbacterium sp. W4I4]MDQ0615878.1 MFS family permease [Microbacterium sp. W4I4]
MAAVSRFRMIIICLALLLEGMSTSGINVQLGALRAELALGEGSLQFVASAFLIAYAGMLPIAGSLADSFDRRRIFLLGIVFFGLGCVLCALAWSAESLVTGRIVQGAGAALSAPAALALITAGLPQGLERNRAVAIYGTMGAIGFSLGLVVPGAAVTWFGWRWSFLISVPVVLLVLAATWGLRSAAQHHGRRPDVLGAVVLTVGLMLAVHLLGSMSTSEPLRMLAQLALLVVAACWLMLRRGVRGIPRAVVTEPRFIAACLALGGLFAGVVGSMYVLSLAHAGANGEAALTVALLIVAQPVAFSLTAGIGSRLVTRWGAPRVFASGAVVFALSLSWLGWAQSVLTHAHALPVSQLPPNTELLPVWIAMIPAMAGVGLSLGLCFPAASVGAVDATPLEFRATTAGLLTTAQNIGGALGIAVLTAIGAVPAAADVGADPGAAVGTALLWSAGFALIGLASASIVLLVTADRRRTGAPASVRAEVLR